MLIQYLPQPMACYVPCSYRRSNDEYARFSPSSFFMQSWSTVDKNKNRICIFLIFPFFLLMKNMFHYTEHLFLSLLFRVMMRQVILYFFKQAICLSNRYFKVKKTLYFHAFSLIKAILIFSHASLLKKNTFYMLKISERNYYT